MKYYDYDYMPKVSRRIWDIYDLYDIKQFCYRERLIPQNIYVNNKRFITNFYEIQKSVKTCKYCGHTYDYDVDKPCNYGDEEDLYGWKCSICYKKWFYGNKKCNPLGIQSLILNYEVEVEDFINLILTDEFIENIKISI